MSPSPNTAKRDEAIELLVLAMNASDSARVGYIEQALDAHASFVLSFVQPGKFTSTDQRIANLRAALASIAGGKPAEEVKTEEDLRERLIWCQESAERTLADDERVGS